MNIMGDIYLPGICERFTEGDCLSVFNAYKKYSSYGGSMRKVGQHNGQLASSACGTRNLMRHLGALLAVIGSKFDVKDFTTSIRV